MLDPPAHLHEPAESAFSVRRARVEKDPEAGLSGVDPLAYGASRVPAFEGDGRDQEVRQRVEEDIRESGELKLVPCPVTVLPNVEACLELLPAVLHRGPPQPGLESVGAEGQEEALSSVLDGREPGRLARKSRPADLER